MTKKVLSCFLLIGLALSVAVISPHEVSAFGKRKVAPKRATTKRPAGKRSVKRSARVVQSSRRSGRIRQAGRRGGHEAMMSANGRFGRRMRGYRRISGPASAMPADRVREIQEALKREGFFEGESTALKRRFKGLVDAEPPAVSSSKWVNSDPLKLDDLKGKVVLLDFWATWCKPCVASIPHTNELNDKYKDKGLVVIGVCHPRGGEKMADSASQNGIRYPICLDDDEKIGKAYKVDGYPDYYLIDRSGKLRIVDCRNQSVDEAVELLINER